jgi:hypothetical protein
VLHYYSMKKIIFTLLSALALPALGDDLKITVNSHSPTEVAMAAAAGFSSVEEFYVDFNRNVELPAATDTLKRTWASLSPQQQRSLRQPESKWERWYNSLPSTTARDIVRRIDALKNHNSELQAWLPQNLRSGPPEYAPGTEHSATPLPPTPGSPPTLQEIGTPLPPTPGGPPTH